MYAKGTKQYDDRQRRRRTIRRGRQGVLLLVLLVVAAWGLHNYLADHHTFAWDRPVSVAVIAVLDDHARDPQKADWFVQRFLSRSARPYQNLREVEKWMQAEYTRHTGDERSVFEFYVRGPIRLKESPPSVPSASDSFLDRWRGIKDFIGYFKELGQRDELNLGDPDISLFIYFYDVHDDERKRVFADFESVATRRDLMGIVFAPISNSRLGHTTAVVAHELCHPLGASDKYNGHSVYPEGYAEPDRSPRFPQRKAEIMALGRPVAADKDAPVRNLSECVVGRVTAAELNWVTADSPD